MATGGYMRNLIIRASLTIIIAAIAVIVILGVTTSAPITNDIALAQLNGGDAAYLEMQVYNHYRDIAYIATWIIAIAATSIIITLFIKYFKEKK